MSAEPTLLAIAGDLTVETAPALLETIRQACRTEGAHLVLSVADARQVDPHGLGALIRGLKIARDAGGMLVIGRATSEVVRMMELTGLDQVVPVGR